MNTTIFLKRHLDAPDEEVPRLVDMAVAALSASTDYPAGSSSEERLWRYLQYPYYLGLFAQKVVAAHGISAHVKEKLCHAVLQINMHLDRGQEPGPGLFQLAAWLADSSLLSFEDYLGLRKGLIWLPRLTDNYIEPRDYILPAANGIFRDPRMEREQVIELILMVLTAKESIGDQGREIFDQFMELPALNKSIKREVCQIVVEMAIPFPRGEYEHPLETTEQEQDRLSIRFLPGAVRRLSVVWLARLGKEPLELLQRLLKPNTVRGHGGDHVASGALDLLNEQWDDIDPEVRSNLLRKAANLPDTAVRKRAYILGEKFEGQPFLEQALDDKAKSLREWAEERIEARQRGVVPSVEELTAELAEQLEE